MKILGNYNIEYMGYYYNLKPSAMDEGDMVYLECGLVVYILGSEIDEYQYKIKINKFINDYLNDIKEIKKMSKLKNRSNFENNELLYFSDYFDERPYLFFILIIKISVYKHIIPRDVVIQLFILKIKKQ